MTTEHTLDDLVTLIDEAAERADALTVESEPSGAVAGASPEATENRTIAGARSRLARAEARQMREGLAELRERARRAADLARGAVDRVTAAAGEAGDVERARAAARRMAEPEGRSDVLEVLLERAVELVPRDGWASVWGRGDDGTLRCEAATDPVVEDLTSDQEATGGPVADVLGGLDGVRVPDLAIDRRWPETARRAGERGVASAFVRRLSTRPRHPVCALVVYGADPVPLGAPQWDALEALADQAMIALAAVRRSEGLRQALEGRDLIGLAKGILVQRDGLEPDEAFTRLVQASQHSNMKLHEVAAWFVDEVRPQPAPPEEDGGAG